ncbi:hypothetical protein ACQ4PT_046778 [Festuca glaucescens]
MSVVLLIDDEGHTTSPLGTEEAAANGCCSATPCGPLHGRHPVRPPSPCHALSCSSHGPGGETSSRWSLAAEDAAGIDQDLEKIGVGGQGYEGGRGAGLGKGGEREVGLMAAGVNLLSRLASLPQRRLSEPAARRPPRLPQSRLCTHLLPRAGVTHREVKPQNILVDADGNLKIFEFGLTALQNSMGTRKAAWRLGVGGWEEEPGEVVNAGAGLGKDTAITNMYSDVLNSVRDHGGEAQGFDVNVTENHLTINAMSLTDGPDLVILQKMHATDVQVMLAGVAMKRLIFPNVGKLPIPASTTVAISELAPSADLVADESDYNLIPSDTELTELAVLGFVSEAQNTLVTTTDLTYALVSELVSSVTSESAMLSAQSVISIGSKLILSRVAGEQVANTEAAGPSAPPRARGRPRKAVTPQVEFQVRRCTRNTNDGYLYEMPNQPSRHRASSVHKAMPPAILQITEMQRLGVEQCLIAPEDLSEARLLQERTV